MGYWLESHSNQINLCSLQESTTYSGTPTIITGLILYQLHTALFISIFFFKPLHAVVLIYKL